MPLLTRAFGRRRGWLVFAQLLLIGAILLQAMTDPAVSPALVALAALLVATTSATQDIVVDAFRVESLTESEQAACMAAYVAAYRIGMLVSTAGALFIVSGFEGTGITRTSAWMWGYVVMASMVLIGTITALAATEPEQSVRAEAATQTETAFARVLHAAVGAFSEFLTRKDALVAKVEVTARNTASGEQRTVTTNKDGEYSFPALAPGDYDITFALPGFATIHETATLNVTEHIAVNATMQISSVATTVDVSSAQPLLHAPLPHR